MELINGHQIPEEMKNLTEDEFLEGAMIAPSFEMDGRTEEDYEPIWLCDTFSKPVFEEHGYEIVELPEFDKTCVVLRHKGETVGFYMDAQLWVDDEHRGQSFGAKMVVCASALTGEAPNVTFVGFSDEGYNAHVKALELAREAVLKPTM